MIDSPWIGIGLGQPRRQERRGSSPCQALRIDGIGGRADRIGGRADRIGDRLDGDAVGADRIDSRVDGGAEGADRIDDRLDGIDRRLDGIAEGADRIDGRVDGIARRKDSSLLAFFEKTIQYHGQAALRGVKTRRKNAEAAAGAEAGTEAEASQAG